MSSSVKVIVVGAELAETVTTAPDDGTRRKVTILLTFAGKYAKTRMR